VAVAAALVGTIVGELPTGAIEGLGARMLIGQLVRRAADHVGGAVRRGDPGRAGSWWC
jgi:ABC-type nitrate/sulfonate/bicarbonate transport system permease component